MRLAHLLKVSRLESLTDGIFAIAMTILVLDLRIPSSSLSGDLMQILEADILYKLVVYGVSFAILGTHWVAMNFQWGLLQQLNRQYLWTNILYLMIICVIPFSANLVASFPNNVASIYFYAINLLLCSIFQLIIFRCAHHYKLNSDLYTNAIGRAISNRVIVAPLFYLSAMILATWNTRLAFLLLLAPTVIYIFPGMIDKYELVEKD